MRLIFEPTQRPIIPIFNVEKIYILMPRIDQMQMKQFILLFMRLLFGTIFHLNATQMVVRLLINISLSTELLFMTNRILRCYTSWFITWTPTQNTTHRLLHTIYSSFIADHLKNQKVEKFRRCLSQHQLLLAKVIIVVSPIHGSCYSLG